MNQLYPSVNGVACSWADIAVKLTVLGGDLLETADIAAIKWGRKVDQGDQRGTSGGRVMARTTGQGSQEASFTLYRSGHRSLLKALMKQAPKRGNQRVISVVSFDILVQHTPLGETEIYANKLKGCRYVGDSDDMKEGNDPDKIEVTLNIIEAANLIGGEEVVLL